MVTGPSDWMVVLCAVATLAAVPLLTLCVCTLDRLLQTRMRLRFGGKGISFVSAFAGEMASFRDSVFAEAAPDDCEPLWTWGAPFASFFFALMGLAILALGPLTHLADLSTDLVLVCAAGACSGFAALLSGTFEHGKIAAADVFRAALKFIACDTAAVLALISAALLAGSLSISEIAQAQWERGAWLVAFVPIAFAIYMVGSACGAQGASLGAFLHDDSDRPASGNGVRGLLFIVGDSINIVTIAGVAAIVFLGGAARPLARYHDRLLGTSIELFDALPAILLLVAGAAFLRRALRERHGAADFSQSVPRTELVASALCLSFAILDGGALLIGHSATAVANGVFWLCAKTLACVLMLLWLRIAADAVRFAQWMKFAWGFLIPLALANIAGAAIAVALRQSLAWSPGWTGLVTVGVALATALLLVRGRKERRLELRAARRTDAAE